MWPRAAPALGHGNDAAVVHAALHHHVDLDRTEARGCGGVDAFEHFRHREIGVVHRAESRVVERVEAHSDPAKSGARQRWSLRSEERAVGGQCHFHVQLRQHLHQAIQVAPHQRLAAGEADLLHAEADEHAREPRDLLEAEDRLVRQEAVARVEHVARHAVRATEVAAVGDRNAQVAHLAAARVGDFFRAKRWRGRDPAGMPIGMTFCIKGFSLGKSL